MTTLNSDARRLNVKGLLIAVGLPVVLVGALVATLLGTGAFSRDNQGEDASMWLWTTPLGEIARVNGLTAATDARFEVTDAAGNPVQIEQTDTHLLLRNIATGEVSAIDLATLALTGSAETAPGEGVRIALHDEGAFIVDQVQGKVNQVDPQTLTPIGDPLSFPAGLTGGAFSADGRLWIGVPREGTVVEIEPRDEGAKTLSTKAVAEPRQDLSLTVLGDGVAVLNKTAQKMTTIRGDRLAVADIELLGPAETAETSPGTIAAVTVTDPPSVVTVDEDRSKTFTIEAGPSQLLGAALEFHERVYVPDGAAGLVWVYDLDGNEIDRIEIDSGNGPIELYHSGDTLFANAVNTNNAVVVSSDGTSRLAPKDRDDILGGNAPPEDEDESGDGDEGDEGDGESGQQEGPPGAVTDLAGTAGDGMVTLSWGAAPNNGSALTKYVVEGAGATWEIAPGQRVLEIDGLTNGDSYTFTVTAHNAHGAGDTATSPSIMPSAEIPAPPTNVAATANPDGTVEVTWDEADGQGNTVTGYQVEAIGGDGDRQVVGDAGGTAMTTAEGQLRYGVQYAFVVTALAGSAASEPSEQSASVTPFNVPGAPGDLIANTASDAAGSIDVTWSQPANNGRPIERYIVRAGAQTQEVSGQTNVRLDGFAEGENVQVTVTAVNEAGESDPAQTTANTMVKPSVQISGHSATATSITLNLTYDDGGGDATCDLLRDGATKVNGGSCQNLTESGLRASTEHTYTVRINNPAGSSTTAAYTASTSTVKVTIHFECDDPSGDPYCDGTDSDRISIRKGTSHDTAEVGLTGPGATFNASCYAANGDKVTPRGTDSLGVYRDYHKNKNDSTIWVLVPGKGGYIPFVWLRVDGAGVNSTGDLPKC